MNDADFLIMYEEGVTVYSVIHVFCASLKCVNVYFCR